MNQPLVCVCIPCYNAEKTIVETLESIRDQSYSNIEIHLFDNGSTDHTVELAKSVPEVDVHLHLSEEGGTAESNFTRCLNLGRGDYTAIFHSDDLYSSSMVEKEVCFLEDNPDAGGVLTFADIIDEDSRQKRRVYAPSSLNIRHGEHGSFQLPELLKAVLRDNNFFFCPSAMIRTRVCTDVLKEWRGGMFGPGADLDTWFRIAEAGALGLINQPLLQYRVSTTHFSHAYNKLNTHRGDLFAILDYWMERPAVTNSLTADDREWYRTWLMRDDVIRARNALRKNEPELAREILKGVSFMRLFRQGMCSLRGFKFFVLTVQAVLKRRVQ